MLKDIYDAMVCCHEQKVAVQAEGSPLTAARHEARPAVPPPRLPRPHHYHHVAPRVMNREVDGV